MADKKISDLGDGGAPQDPDDFVVARGGTNVKLAWSSLSAVAASNQIAVTVDGNTAGVLAPMTSGTVTLAGGNNITLSQVGNAVTISGPNAGGAQTGISSIGNSETTYSSGAIELVNTGAITIASNAGQQFVFSVDPQSVQPETQTFIGGISASDTAYTSGTVRITGVGGGVTVSSNTGQRIDISVAAQSVQPETQTFVAGISASDTLYTSGNVRLTGVGGGVTVSSNTGQRVDISVAAQSVQPETQTFIAGVSASDTLYTSGNVRITGVGGGITVSSNTGQRIDLSVAAQSVQTQNLIAATVSGHTAGALALISSGTLTFAGGNNITLSQAGNAVTVMGADGGAIPYTYDDSATAGDPGPGKLRFNDADPEVATQIYIDDLDFNGLDQSGTLESFFNTSIGSMFSGWIRLYSASDPTNYLVRQFVLSDSGGYFTIYLLNPFISGGALTLIPGDTLIEFDRTDFPSVVYVNATDPISSGFTPTPGQFWLDSDNNNLYIRNANATGWELVNGLRGISDGANTLTSGTVNLTNANGVSFSINAQTLSASVNQSISMFAVSNTTQATSGTAHKSALSFGGAGAASVGVTGGSVVVSANAQTTQTQGILAVGASTGGNTSGNTGVATGTRLVLVGSNGITVSQGTAANATTLTLSGITQTVQTQGGFVSLGVSTGGNTVGNTQVSTGTRFVLVGSNMVSLSQATAAGASTVTIDATNQNLSIGASTGGNTAGNTTVNSGSRLVFVGSNNITVSQGTAAGATTLTISGPATSAQQTGISGVSNSNTTYTSGTIGLSELGAITIRSTTGNQFQFSVNSQTAQTQSNIAALYDGANSISTGTVRVTNANGVSFSVNAQTLSASVNESISMFAVSNTTQNTSGTAHKSALSFGGAGIASVGVTGGSVVISVPSGGGAGDGGVFAGASTMGNTAGSTGTVSTGNFVLVGTGPISLSQSTGAAGSAATISINAPATSSLSGTGGVQISTNGSTISIGAPYVSAAAWENMPIMEGVLYTHISGVSKTPFYWPENVPALTPANIAFRVSMVTASADLSLSAHFGVYTFVNSTSIALLGSASDAFVVSAGSSVSFSAQRQLILTSPGTVAAISNMTPGNYVFGMMFSASATGAMNASIYAASAAAGPRVGRIMPGTNQLSTATSQGIAGLYGRGSTTVNAMPANVVASEVVNQGIGASSPMKPHIFIRS